MCSLKVVQLKMSWLHKTLSEKLGFAYNSWKSMAIVKKFKFDKKKTLLSKIQKPQGERFFQILPMIFLNFNFSFFNELCRFFSSSHHEYL